MNLLIRKLEIFTVIVCIGFATAQDTLDTLGYGFSAYDGTFDNFRVRARVLDLGSLTTTNGFQIREKVDARFYDTVRKEEHSAEGFNEFTTSLKSSVSIGGSYAGFKANVKGRYSSEVSERFEYYFSRIALVVERVRLQINAHSSSAMRALVIPEVARELESSSPYSIFAKYGTHVTTGVLAGGMLELWSYSDKSIFSSKVEYDVSASLSFKSFMEGSGSLTIEERRKASKAQSREGLVVHGGNLQVGADGRQKWIDSTKTNAQTIKFVSGGAIPIWELVSDSSQAHRLRTYYQQVFGAKSIILKRFESQNLLDTPRVPHPRANVYVPNGWKVLSGGADIAHYGSGQLLTKSYPIVNGYGVPVGWSVESKDHLKSDPGQIQAYAIAIWDPNNNWDIIVRKSLSSKAPHPSSTAAIPAGYILVGGGADVQWKGLGNLLVETYPVSSYSWKSSSKDHLKSDPAQIWSYAIGLKHRDGGSLSSRQRNNRFGPAQHPKGSIQSTKGWSFVGCGASISKGGVGNMLVRIIPDSTGQSIFAYGKDHLKADRRYITVYGIEVYGATYVLDTSSVLGLDPDAL